MSGLPESPDDDVDRYVGLDRESAEERARGRGWSVRSLAPDAVITAEFVRNRINFVVIDDIVTRAWKG